MKRITMRTRKALILAALATQSATAQAGDAASVYRCNGPGGKAHYTPRPDPGAQCVLIVTQQVAVPLSGPPTILRQCMDAPQPEGEANLLIGPSARARECTRQYCAQAAYKAKVTAYAMSRQQNAEDARDALTCISRSEQDMK